MFNIVYNPMGEDYFCTWDLSDGFVRAAEKEGVLNKAYETKELVLDEDTLTNLRKYPTIVPADHRKPLFNVPDVKGARWIKIESESVMRPDSTPCIFNEFMKSNANKFERVYTFCWEDQFNYYGRKIDFTFEYIDHEMFRPIGILTTPRILAFGSRTRERHEFYKLMKNVIEHKMSESKKNSREDAESLNNLVNQYDCVLAPKSAYARFLVGKAFYGFAARKLVYIEDTEFVQYCKDTIVPNVHAVYYSGELDLRKKFEFYYKNRAERERIADAGHKLCLEKFTTRAFVRRLDNDLNPISK